MLAKGERGENPIEFFAKKIALWIQRRNSMGELEYLKMKLGMEVILINATKGMIVYGMAILLNVFLSTLVLHSAYFAMRRVSFGLHAKSSVNCTKISILLFVVIPYLVKDIAIDNYFVTLFFLLYTCCFYMYAPADTEKHPIIREQKRQALRKQSVITCILLMVIALVVPIPMIKILTTVGVGLQVVHIVPLTYKLLKRSYNNYEKYEAKINE